MGTILLRRAQKGITTPELEEFLSITEVQLEKIDVGDSSNE